MNKLIIKMIPCECESKCGILIPEFDSQGRKRRFVNGHGGRGKKHSPESKQLMSENRIGKCVGEKHYLYGKHPSDATRQLISENRTGKRSGENHPNYGKPLSDITKKKIGDGNRGKYCGENNPFFGKNHSPETKQKISKNHADVGGENNPMYGRCGENNPNWKGGITYNPYCQEFDKWLKEEIKERDDHQCQNPNCSKTAKRLACHHIDYDKKNCSTNNLVTICRSCNAKANGNRNYWKEFYNNILEQKSITNKLEEIF